MDGEETFLKEEVNANGQRVSSLRSRLNAILQGEQERTTGASVSARSTNTTKDFNQKKYEHTLTRKEEEREDPYGARSRFG